MISSQRNTRSRYIKNYTFNYRNESHFTVTAVSGHLLDYEFDAQYSNWNSCDPFVLFDAPIYTKIKKDMKDAEANLKTQAAHHDILMIWTDCDREGENIGAEVADVCRKANPRIQVKRARFSAVIAQ